jgi:hypothetical protein
MWRREIAGRGEQSQVEASDRRWMGATACGGERLQVEAIDRRY